MSRPVSLSGRIAWDERSAGPVRRGHGSAEWWTSVALGAIAALGPGALTQGVPGPTIPGTTTGPVDRAVIAIPPIYPGVPSGFLRLPATGFTPAGPTVAPGFPGPGPVVPGVRDDFRFPSFGRVEPRMGGPIWRPARLEPTAGIDARGRLTSILEYTPGRFER